MCFLHSVGSRCATARPVIFIPSVIFGPSSGSKLASTPLWPPLRLNSQITHFIWESTVTWNEAAQERPHGSLSLV